MSSSNPPELPTPSDKASLTIKLVKHGEVAASVPGRETGSLLEAVIVGLGIIAGPSGALGVAKAFELTGLMMPWWAGAGLVLCGLCLPILGAGLWVRSRRRRRRR